MKNSIQSLLLIEGDPQSARPNELMIQNTNMVEHVAVAFNADNAMNYISQRLAVGKGLPSIILIDIHLIDSIAWAFLDRFQMEFRDMEYPAIYLLSDDASSQDVIRASMHPLTDGIINLPLIDWEITKLLKKHKPQYASYVA